MKRPIHLVLVLPLLDLVDRANSLDGRPHGPQNRVAVLDEILPRSYAAPAERFRNVRDVPNIRPIPKCLSVFLGERSKYTRT